MTAVIFRQNVSALARLRSRCVPSVDLDIILIACECRVPVVLSESPLTFKFQWHWDQTGREYALGLWTLSQCR